MRKQSTRVKTGAARRWAALLTIAVLTALIAAAAILIYLYEPPYRPPPLEPGTLTGVPNPPANMRYGEIDAMGKFTFGIAATTYQQEDSSLAVYLTNNESNAVYLMCEIIDPLKKQILYRSGLLRPGEHVERLYPLRPLKNEAVDIEILVYALDLESYVSVGTVTLDNILQPH